MSLCVILSRKSSCVRPCWDKLKFWDLDRLNWSVRSWSLSRTQSLIFGESRRGKFYSVLCCVIMKYFFEFRIRTFGCQWSTCWRRRRRCQLLRSSSRVDSLERQLPSWKALIWPTRKRRVRFITSLREVSVDSRERIDNCLRYVAHLILYNHVVAMLYWWGWVDLAFKWVAGCRLTMKCVT